jgi:hypothetical protein
MEITFSMSNCRSGCKTQDHANWGECAKAANFSITDPLSSAASKLANKELDAYRNARKNGIQPASTKLKDIEKAVRMSDKAGKALQA